MLHASSSAAVNMFGQARGLSIKKASATNLFRLICIVCLLLPGATLFAQEFTGRVTDSSGAAIAKAKISVTNQDTKVVVRTVTTHSGDYTVPYLRPGLYSVSAEAQGFSQEVHTEITLQVGQTATINFALVVGSVTETVTVRTDEALLAGSGDVGEVVESTRVSELPLNGSNPMALLGLSAGATLGAAPHDAAFR